MDKIPFNKPFLTGDEITYIADAHNRCQLAGDGFYTKKCHRWLEEYLDAPKALLTHSCTAALEMAAILLNIKPGDEVIMPSYTFVSTANAFVLRGAIPVFIDIRPDTQNIDESLIESAITKSTKAIVVVHYAGVACEMDSIKSIAQKHGLFLIEDAAQALLSSYKGQPLGSFGDLACFSFHETKNIISGEGGALIVNNPELVERAEIIREKGTNRSLFFRGAVDKYTWVDIGSSYLPGELTAAFLWAQLQHSLDITNSRNLIWQVYHDSLSQLHRQHSIILPSCESSIQHNAHMYYLKFPSLRERTEFITHMSLHSIYSVFHYIPLHTSPFISASPRVHQSELPHTNKCADTIVRLPLWIGIDNHLPRILDAIFKFF